MRPLSLRVSRAATALVLVVALAACGGADAAGADLFDSSVVHDIDVSFDEQEYQQLVDTYAETGQKDWMEATVTIDGTTIDGVGMRLKGNSSLSGLGGGFAGGAGFRGGEGIPEGGPGGATASPDDAASEDTPADASTEGDASARPQRPGGAGGAPGGGFPGGGMGGATADEPESLPWLIDLDKFVANQEYQGYTSFVVRSNTSETSLNEAVALEIFGAAGQPTQQAFATSFSVNGGEEALRLAIEEPNDRWEEESFDGDGVLYKAEAGGDYSYRGDDPAAYEGVFDQETDTDAEDLTPLIEFLEWLNTSDDATFAAELDEKLDVQAFAEYLALQELVNNADDIDGPGNNSYLRYDSGTEQFTVVNWDLNLAFGGMGMGMGGGRPGMRGGFDSNNMPEGMPSELPEGFSPENMREGMPAAPEGFDPENMPEGRQRPGGGRGGSGGGNVLAERFMANDDFQALYATALEELRAEIYGSGEVNEILDRWTSVLTNQATDLVDEATITTEAERIRDSFNAATTD